MEFQSRPSFCIFFQSYLSLRNSSGTQISIRPSPTSLFHPTHPSSPMATPQSYKEQVLQELKAQLSQIHLPIFLLYMNWKVWTKTFDPVLLKFQLHKGYSLYF